jgi:hypothetical protein
MTWYAPDPFQIPNGKKTHPPYTFLSVYSFPKCSYTVYFYVSSRFKVTYFAQSKRICWSVLFTLKHQMETSLLMFFFPLFLTIGREFGIF